MTLVAEGTTGTFLGAEVMFCKDGKDVLLAEDFGQQATILLFCMCWCGLLMHSRML